MRVLEDGVRLGSRCSIAPKHYTKYLLEYGTEFRMSISRHFSVLLNPSGKSLLYYHENIE